jgi:hypothetical protein
MMLGLDAFQVLSGRLKASSTSAAAPDLMQQISETLAGRVAYVDIGPIHAL